MYTVEQVKNASWKNAEHTILECEVKFAEVDVFLPFGASNEGDQYAHTLEVFSRVVAGEAGDIAEYVAPEEFVPPQPISQGAQTL